MDSFGVRVGIRVYVKPFCSWLQNHKNQSHVKFSGERISKRVRAILDCLLLPTSTNLNFASSIVF